jgi:hypothetical protein
MREIRDSFRRMAIVVAAAGVFVAPATASASEVGGLGPTRECVQEEVNTYSYTPGSVSAANTMVRRSAACVGAFVQTVRNPQHQANWRACLQAGIDQSNFPTDPTPFADALYRCTATWLEFAIQIDPNPN